MLTSYHYTVTPSIIEEWKAIKNEAEIAGMRAAYIRDGVAYVKWLAWLDFKMTFARISISPAISNSAPV